MRSSYVVDVRKRPVNRTLNEDLVKHAKSITDNLSGVIESLLADFVARERRGRLEKSKAIESTVALWNEFNAAKGSIADKYSTR